MIEYKMKKSILAIIICLFAIIGVSECIAHIGNAVSKPHANPYVEAYNELIDSIHGLNGRLDDAIHENDAFEDYYECTENMLDSLGLDLDNPCFETDYGSDYLDAKQRLDSIYNSNHDAEPVVYKHLQHFKWAEC